MPDQPTDTPIPVQHQATQVPPPPQGTIRAKLVELLGPSYRTTMLGYMVGIPWIADYVITHCPRLLSGVWDKTEVWGLFWHAIGPGGVIALGHAAKDVSATGVQR